MTLVPVNVVADLLGHEKASFTIARYGHALPKQMQVAAMKWVFPANRRYEDPATGQRCPTNYGM